MSKSYSERVMRFRRGVYAARKSLTPGCQLLLLRLSDSMDAKAVVSVPRSTLAHDLNCPPARISEWIAEAKEAGFVSVVRRARPQVTAVYQGLFVAPSERYAPADLRGTPEPPSGEVRPSVPLGGVLRYATHPTQVVAPEVPSGECLPRRLLDEAPRGA